MIVVDLFSGTGAATKAFRDRGHKVVTVDIAGKPDIRADVRRLPLRNLKPDFIWASPPCTEFSLARRGGGRGDIEAGMQLVAAACDAIAQLTPRYWVIENVIGAMKVIGPGFKRVGSFILWGRFPIFDAGQPTKGLRQMLDKDGKRGPRLSSARGVDRAAIPYALSLALCQAIERDLQ